MFRQGASYTGRFRWLAICLGDTFLAGAWMLLGMRAMRFWLESGALDMLLLFITNSLFAALFLFRRREVLVSDDLCHWLVTILTILLSFFFRGSESAPGGRIQAVSQVGLVVGMVIVLISLLSLGRSFGLVPANRGVKVSGLYRFARHPLYTGQLFVYISFVAGNLIWHNGLIFCGILIGLVYRAIAEERFLAKDEAYEEYLSKVRYRFVPGLY